MSDYTSIGLNDSMISSTSLINQVTKSSNLDTYLNNPRGGVRQMQTSVNSLYAISNTGTTSFVLGATGSGTEIARVSSTLASRSNKDKLFAIHELALFQGVSATGTGQIFAYGGIAGTFNMGTNYTISTYFDWYNTINRNLIAATVIKNNSGALGTIYYSDQWRYLQPPGGGV
jgi:hypothetical protein